jgi:putative acetyltransferase
MQIRKATVADLDDLDIIYRRSIAELCAQDYDAEVIDAWKDSVPVEARVPSIEKGALWVAVLGETIAGYMVAVPGEIIALFISPDFSGKGVGRRLAELALELASRNEPDEIVLESTLTALPFYQKLGFKETSRGYFTHGEANIEIAIVNMVRSSNCS